MENGKLKIINLSIWVSYTLPCPFLPFLPFCAHSPSELEGEPERLGHLFLSPKLGEMVRSTREVCLTVDG